MFACKRPDPIRLQPTIEEPAAPASVVRIADPSTSEQLLRGFYGRENGSWRWTAPKFTVALGVPPSAPKLGAALALDFTLPDASVRELKRITIGASVGGEKLSPETFDTPGAHEYRREIPAAAFDEGRGERRFHGRQVRAA